MGFEVVGSTSVLNLEHICFILTSGLPELKGRECREELVKRKTPKKQQYLLRTKTAASGV